MEKQSSIISEGIIVIIITALSYALAFTYLTGYLSYYKIPIEMVSFSIVDLITFTFKMLVKAFMFLLLYFIIKYFIVTGFPNRNQNSLYRYFTLIKYSILSLLLMIYLYRFENTFVLIFMSSMVVFQIVIFLVIPIFNFKGISYINKLKKQADSDSKDRIPYFDYISSKVGSKNFMLLLFGFYLFYFAYSAGESEAMTKIGNYFIESGNKKDIVLIVQSDRIICAPFNEVDNTYKHEFKIINNPNEKEYSLIYKEIKNVKLNKN